MAAVGFCPGKERNKTTEKEQKWAVIVLYHTQLWSLLLFSIAYPVVMIKRRDLYLVCEPWSQFLNGRFSFSYKRTTLKFNLSLFIDNCISTISHANQRQIISLCDKYPQKSVWIGRHFVFYFSSFDGKELSTF